jgi:alpha-methylacyl-CoA racemase
LPTLRATFAGIFGQHGRDHWYRRFEGSDACVTPVLSLAELAAHPHLQERQSFAEVDGVAHPAPAPRFSRTPGRIAGPPVERGTGGAMALKDWGFSASDPALGGLRWTDGPGTGGG